MSAIFSITKRLLSSNKVSFILTALVVLCATSSGEVVLSNGNYTWLLAVLTPFFFVFYDFTKLMHLGASKKDYYLGCLISYGFLAFCISLTFSLDFSCISGPKTKPIPQPFAALCSIADFSRKGWRKKPWSISCGG